MKSKTITVLLILILILAGCTWKENKGTDEETDISQFLPSDIPVAQETAPSQEPEMGHLPADFPTWIDYESRSDLELLTFLYSSYSLAFYDVEGNLVYGIVDRDKGKFAEIGPQEVRAATCGESIIVLMDGHIVRLDSDFIPMAPQPVVPAEYTVLGISGDTLNDQILLLCSGEDDQLALLLMDSDGGMGTLTEAGYPGLLWDKKLTDRFHLFVEGDMIQLLERTGEFALCFSTTDGAATPYHADVQLNGDGWMVTVAHYIPFESPQWNGDLVVALWLDGALSYAHKAANTHYFMNYESTTQIINEILQIDYNEDTHVVTLTQPTEITKLYMETGAVTSTVRFPYTDFDGAILQNGIYGLYRVDLGGFNYNDHTVKYYIYSPQTETGRYLFETYSERVPQSTSAMTDTLLYRFSTGEAYSLSTGELLDWSLARPDEAIFTDYFGIDWHAWGLSYIPQWNCYLVAFATNTDIAWEPDTYIPMEGPYPYELTFELYSAEGKQLWTIPTDFYIPITPWGGWGWFPRAMDLDVYETRVLFHNGSDLNPSYNGNFLQGKLIDLNLEDFTYRILEGETWSRDNDAIVTCAFSSASREINRDGEDSKYERFYTATLYQYRDGVLVAQATMDDEFDYSNRTIQYNAQTDRVIVYRGSDAELVWDMADLWEYAV